MESKITVSLVSIPNFGVAFINIKKIC